MDVYSSPKYRALQQEVRSFAKKHAHLSPGTRGGRKRPDKHALDWQKLLLDCGYFARNIPKEYGGLGLPLDVMELAIIADEFSSAGVSPGIYRHSIGVIRRCVSSQSLIGSIA